MLRAVNDCLVRRVLFVAIAAGIAATVARVDAAEPAPRADATLNGDAGIAAEVKPAPAPRELLLVVNSAALRAHPLGSRASALVASLPFWKRTFGGSDLDPARDTDWVSLTSESLQKAERDVTLLKFSISDAEADKQIAKVNRTSKHAYVRVHPHMLAVVPPNEVRGSERTLRTGKPSFKSTEVARLSLHSPGTHFPALALAKPIRELHVAVRAGGNGGAEADLEGDCDDAPAAKEAADAVNALVARSAFWGNLLTGGLLRGMHATSERNGVKMHVVATRAQLEALLNLVAPSAAVAPPPKATVTAPSSSSTSPRVPVLDAGAR